MTYRTIIKWILGSTIVWIIVLLFLVDISLIKFRPLQYVNDLRFIPLDQHPMFAKISKYMESNESVDVLVLGSSLPMCAIAEYDQQVFGSPNCNDVNQVRRYSDAKFLDQQFSRQFGRSIHTANLSIVACMASDMYIILQKSLAAQRKPKIVFLCIAPRDFVDNLVQPIGRTPPFEILQDWKTLGDVLHRQLPMVEKRNLLISAFWYFYRVKADYRTVLTQYFSTLVSHPPSLFYASTQAADVPVVKSEAALPPCLPAGGVNGKDSLEKADLVPHSVDRYRPPNFTRFAQEMEFFAKLVAMCKQENIQCVVVNMPMTVAHRTILDQRLDQKYLRETQKICRDAQATYLDLNDKEFVETDFIDGFHVNKSGAEKLMKRLVTDITAQRVEPLFQ